MRSGEAFPFRQAAQLPLQAQQRSPGRKTSGLQDGLGSPQDNLLGGWEHWGNNHPGAATTSERGDSGGIWDGTLHLTNQVIGE